MSLYLSMWSLLLWAAPTNRGNTNWGVVFVHSSSLWKREFARMRKWSRHSKDSTRPVNLNILLLHVHICTMKEIHDVRLFLENFILIKSDGMPPFFGGLSYERYIFFKLAYNIFEYNIWNCTITGPQSVYLIFLQAFWAL